MIITHDQWREYIDVLRNISDTAADEMADFVNELKINTNLSNDQKRNALIDYAYGLATKYGEASAAVSAEMYDAVAIIQGAAVPPAVPAETATISEAAKTVNGILKQSDNVDMLSAGVGRLVKTAGVDTTIYNALRDGAEWAWVPQGDTCAFCITLASRGWQRASKNALKNGHAEHIHANCDCTYAVRFDGKSDVAGYDPDNYYLMYKNAADGSPTDKVNAMRREAYAKNKKEINAQKRSAYQKRKELNSSEAEEIDV